MSYNTDPVNNDTDSDGLLDGEEILFYYTNPLSSDTDNDGMNDCWEVNYGLNPLSDDSSEDPDSDNLTNIQEYELKTSPVDSDTDDDGMPDGWEVKYNLDPLKNDAYNDDDNDGLKNIEEYTIGTDPTNADTDGDGELDGYEVKNGFNPLDPSSNLANYKKRRLILKLAILSSSIFFTIIVIAIILYRLHKKRLSYAYSLGFRSLQHMKEIQSLGFSTYNEWSIAHSAGFSTKEEFDIAQSLNVSTRKDLLALASSTLDEIINDLLSYRSTFNTIESSIPEIYKEDLVSRNFEEIERIYNNLSAISSKYNWIVKLSKTEFDKKLEKIENLISTLQVQYSSIVDKLNDRKKFLVLWNKVIELLNTFRPNVLVTLQRISELLNIERNTAEKYIKDILNVMPEVGEYLDLEQVFIRHSVADIEIDKLLREYEKWEKTGKGKKS